jgi:hypothetical protein
MAVSLADMERSIKGDRDMGDECREHCGTRVLECSPDGPKVACERDAADLVNEAFNAKASMIAVPVERLGEEFFTLSTRVAGEVVQKVVNYGLKLAVVGDISRYLKKSAPLRDWVRESNRGADLWFVEDFIGLDKKLEARLHEAE